MGKNKMALKLNRTVEEASQILANFDEKVPFVKEIADSCTNAAQKRGYIKTLLGRRRHFNFWEPIDSFKMRQEGKDVSPCRLEFAEQKWPGLRLQRANAHKALNALIQGSAADMNKAALIKIRRECDVIPYMAVHDEIDFPANDEAHANQCKGSAETCVTMTVPIKADLSLGKSWR
jgi:DNA polymerase-1